MLESAFSQIALTLIVAAVVGFLANLLRQPLIVAYIFVGILLGPAFLGLVSAQSMPQAPEPGEPRAPSRARMVPTVTP